ncbi:MAG TPA: hypothetical protein DIW47_03850 [Bacteroidetes bacterium]|nr:hypothetical protein [Bacteroidota bacterium]
MPKVCFSIIGSVFIVLSGFAYTGCKPSANKHTLRDKKGQQDSGFAPRHFLLKTDYSAVTATQIQKDGVLRLQNQIDSLCRYYLNNDSISGISVAYTDLRSNTGFTLYPQKRFVPASLLKLPILVAAFKLEEEKPGSLSTSIPVYEVLNDVIDRNLEESETFPFQANRQYTLRELVQIMISHSDNRATLSVMEFLNKQSPGIVERVEADLEASIPTGVDNNAEIVYIGHFASMLNALYSCDYLSPLHSAAALEILCMSRYQRGFRKSIPEHIRIAHKFGVRFNVSELNPLFPVQLHEVALIYHPSNPFILSVMTKGSHVEPLRAALREIAATCYNEIDVLSNRH